MYQIRCGTVLLLTTSLLGNIFTLAFFCLTSIWNTKAKHVLVAIAATGFSMAKMYLKIIIKMHLIELLQFFEFFTFVLNLSNTVDLSNRCRCLIILKSDDV